MTASALPAWVRRRYSFDPRLRPFTLPHPACARQRATTIEQPVGLTHIAVQIELAEEGAVDADTVWKALCNHLNGRGLEDVLQ